MDALHTEGLLDIMEFKYVAYGNANWNGGNVSCQHGPQECYANIAENCATHVAGDKPLVYMPFVQCVEDGNAITKAKVDSCCAKHNIDAAKVNACMSGPLGKLLEKQAYEATPPKHTYVPWVVRPDGTVFGPHDFPITKEKIIKAACDFWKGKKPACCTKLSQVHEPCLNADL